MYSFDVLMYIIESIYIKCVYYGIIYGEYYSILWPLCELFRFYLRPILFCVRVSTNTQIATACVLECLLVLAWVLIYTRLGSELSSFQAFWTHHWLRRRVLIGCRGLHQQWHHEWWLCDLRNIQNRERCHLFSFRSDVLSEV